MLSEALKWEDNGVISLAQNPERRMVLYESENIDYLFRGLGELIGYPIDNIVMESRRRDTRRFIDRLFPAETRLTRESGLAERVGEREAVDLVISEEWLETFKAYNIQVNEIGRLYGYGNIQLSDRWERGESYPWRKQVVTSPYSELFYPAEMLGSCEAFEGIDMRVKFERVGGDVYEVTASPGSHPLELGERLKKRRYEFKPGEIGLERCGECGVSLDVSRFVWDLEKGTIFDSRTSRRMAIFGPGAAEAVFDDLEKELGEAIPDAIIEAQRRYVKSAWSEDEWGREALDFRRMIAVRGLGNLTRFEGERDRLSVTIQNSCMHLGVVGTVQALMELAYGLNDSMLEWELAEDGGLSITIKRP
jgi:hypothetical protein